MAEMLETVSAGMKVVKWVGDWALKSADAMVVYLDETKVAMKVVHLAA
jgi:hypothetical protein